MKYLEVDRDAPVTGLVLVETHAESPDQTPSSCERHSVYARHTHTHTHPHAVHLAKVFYLRDSARDVLSGFRAKGGSTCCAFICFTAQIRSVYIPSCNCIFICPYVIQLVCVVCSLKMLIECSFNIVLTSCLRTLSACTCVKHVHSVC